MRELTAEEKTILERHQKWIDGEDGGEKADLCGANLRGANLYGANGLAVTSAGPLGRDNRITYFKYLIDEVDCGCFRGTLDEFAANVEETYKDNPAYLAEYRAAIEFFRAVKDAR